MSEIKEKLIGPKNVRSQILKVVVLSIVLICAFAFSTLLFSLLFGGIRTVPSTYYDDADYKPLIDTPIPIPWDLSDLLDFFQSLGLQLDEDMLETLLDMFDGDFDDIPLDDLAALMAAMLFSEIEVFRIYNYTTTPLTDMEEYLWKYECYDQYLSGTWSSSVGESNLNFYTYNEADLNPLLNNDLLKIKILNITPNVGDNRMTTPTLFPIPYIMENSISAANINNGTIYLRKQDSGLNGTAVRAEFTASTSTNLTYTLASENLRSDAEINASSVIVTSPNAQYTALLDKYLKLDGGSLVNFISNHLAFQDHYNYLYNNVINSGDNAFIKADKIRNYLQYNFNLSYNPVPETEADQDPINWFCNSQEGMYSDFASTFVALTRAFGVASRFVDGFNSRSIEEIWDPEEGMDSFAVKYRNMYSWAEIFVPTDIYGNGKWEQMDVLYENFLGTPPQPIYGNTSYSINVTCNSLTPPLYPVVERNDWVNITATLSNDSLAIAGETITFTDITSGDSLGSNITNIFGDASVFVQVNDSMGVGPHVIAAQFNPQVVGIGNYVINDTVIVELTQVDPPSINVSDPTNNTIHVQGRVYDPKNNVGVAHSDINIVLFENGTDNFISQAFQPSIITTDASGNYDAYLQGDSAHIFPGDYEIRADINGTYNYTIMWYGFEYEFEIPLGFPFAIPVPLTNSSERLSLHVDKELTASVWFYIDDFPSNYPASPVITRVVTRGSILTLKALVLNETGGSMQGVSVDFFNYTGENSLIDSNSTDQYGITTCRIIVGDSCIAGPNLLYARVQNSYNYSYYILNENPNITVVSGPTPFVINKTQGEQFTIVGYLNDSVNSLPLSYSEVELRIFRNSVDDYSFYLTDHVNPFSVFSNGMFSVTFGVNPAIPPGNYSLRLDFNGTFDLTSFPYSYDFNVNYINTSVTLDNQLQITYEAPTFLNFWINGTTSDDFNNPSINRYDDLNLTVRLMLGDIPITGETVFFYDETNTTLIGSDDTDGNGFATIIYSTNYYSIAGPHLLHAWYSSYDNYSYFILNEPININLDICPIPQEINSTTNLGRTFAIIGDLQDAINGINIANGTMEIRLFIGLTEYDSFLIPTGGAQQYLNYFDCNYTGKIFALFNVSSAIPENNFTVRVDFNGTFFYGTPYQHSFSLTYMNASSICTHELKVINPLNATIQLIVDTHPVPDIGVYPDGSLPSIARFGDNITFEGYIYQYGGPASGYAYLYDIYNNPTSWIMSDELDGAGYYNFELNTSVYNFHPGLHLIKVVFENYINDVFNSTYIIINETFTININMNPLDLEIARNDPGFTISGKCYEGTRYLRGMNVTLHLIDSMGQDRSQYLEFSGSNYVITDNNGDYIFNINRISIDCPQGSYTLRVDFNGTIFHNNDIPLFIDITGAMISVSSSTTDLNITASTYFNSGVSNYYTQYQPVTPIEWIYGDTLFVNGTLLWDNGTGVSLLTVTLTVEDRTTGIPIAINATVSTNLLGQFTGTINVDERFEGIDDIADSIISISFSPLDNGLQYVVPPLDEIYN